MEYLGINIDLKKDENYDLIGLQRLKDSYMLDEETSPQQRLAFVSKQFSSNPEHAQRLYNYSSDFWFGYATPIQSFGRNKSGLPISCFLNFVSDTRMGLVDNLSETNWLSMLGGGVGTYWSIRGSDEKSVGVIPHMKVYDDSSLAFRQGTCYHPDVEVLTECGFMTFADAMTKNVKVLQVSVNNETDFVYPTEWVVQDFEGELVNFKDSKNIDVSVTPNHRMYFKRESKIDIGNGKSQRVINDTFEILDAKSCPVHRDVVFANSVKVNGNSKLSDYERFLIAHQADGHRVIIKENEYAVTFHFSENRKIERLESILSNINVEYTKTLAKDSSTNFYVKVVEPRKDFSWVDISEYDANKAKEFLIEVSNWDGTKIKYDTKGRISFSYSSNIKCNADILQGLAAIAGFKSKHSVKIRDNKSELYVIHFSEGETFGGECVKKSDIPYAGKVYCAIVPFGGLVIRSNGHTLVCGNTRRGSYAEYLDISHPDIIEFIEMRKETGDPRRKCLNLHHGVNIPDSFMQIIENCMLDKDFDDSWELKDPVTGKVHEVVSAKELWEKLLEYRAGQGRGEPYIHYIDNTNNAIPQYLKDQNYSVKQSNLCLTGDTLIDIKVNDQISTISLEEFTIKFILGAFNGVVYVKSYSVEDERVVWSEVSAAAKTAEVDELYEIETPSGKVIKCTADHQIWTVNRGYVMAKDLNENDTLLEN